MKTEIVDVNEVQAQLKDLLKRVVAGVHVILRDGETPIAHIVPAGGRVPGLHDGAIWTSDDFDAPLPVEFWGEGK